MAKQEDVITVDLEKLIVPVSIFLSVLIFSISFAFGMHRIGEGLENYGGETVTSTNNDDTNTQGQQLPTQGETPTQEIDPAAMAAAARIDNDAVRGNKDASVAILEFSDFNCSFCKRFHTQGTLEQIIKNYVDTGKVLMVYKDFPGVGGALTEAAGNAAECVRDQKDDAYYFNLVAELFLGDGAVDASTVRAVAERLGGVNLDELDSCIAEERFMDEVIADRDAGTTLGIGGTPSFYIGKINSDGVIEGEVVVGAQPYSVFESVIEKYL